MITDAKKATIALRNAVLEMERRLKLLAAAGRPQYRPVQSCKVSELQEKPRSLFDEGSSPRSQLEPLPYILIIIDELADLMMLERANVEEKASRAWRKWLALSGCIWCWPRNGPAWM